MSVVVPTFRRPETLAATLDALLAVDYPAERYQIIVVDDGDDDATAAAVRGRAPGPVDIELLRQANRGAAAARNRGVRAAEGEHVLLCDDDILVEPSHLAMHAAVKARYGDVLVNGTWRFSPPILAELSTTPFGRFRLDLDRGFHAELAGQPRIDSHCVRADLLSACNLYMNRETFWALGGFDERFPFAGAEDQDLSLRALAAGLVLLRSLEINVLHNDPTLSLRQFCTREERSARTAVVLAQKFPAFGETYGIVTENREVLPGDPAIRRGKKALKGLMGRRGPLAGLHVAISLLERLRAPERVLRRLYRFALALHIFNGVRHQLCLSRGRNSMDAPEVAA